MFFLLLFWAEILCKLETHTGGRMDEARAPVCAVDLSSKAQAGKAAKWLQPGASLAAPAV